jgi:hypothetical protein
MVYNGPSTLYLVFVVFVYSPPVAVVDEPVTQARLDDPSLPARLQQRCRRIRDLFKGEEVDPEFFKKRKAVKGKKARQPEGLHILHFASFLYLTSFIIVSVVDNLVVSCFTFVYKLPVVH